MGVLVPSTCDSNVKKGLLLITPSSHRNQPIQTKIYFKAGGNGGCGKITEK